MRIAFALIATLLITACSQDPDVSVRDVTIRTPLGDSTTTAAYMTIENAGADDQLTSASSRIASRIEIHDHVHTDGIMKMITLDVLPLDKGKTVELKPHGKHLMVFELRQELKDGDEVPLTLHFKRTPDMQVTAVVKTNP